MFASSDKNTEIDLNKISACLTEFGLSEMDYVREGEMLEMISKLNGSPFEQDVFDQVWDQCKLNSKGEVKVA